MSNNNEPRDPRTPDEWQEAVNQAEFFLLLDSARKYGLVTGGPKINAERCDELLRAGRVKGFRPVKNVENRYLSKTT